MQVSGLIGVTLLHHSDQFVDSSSQGSDSMHDPNQREMKAAQKN